MVIMEVHVMWSIIFASGYRVFFPLGAIGAIVILGYWVLLLTGATFYFPSYFAEVSWHQHEMIFGVFVPIIIGFLFTAVPNWTGVPSPSGSALVALALLWLLGRLAVFFGSLLPPLVPVILDVALLPIAVMCIAPAIFATKNKRNYFLPVMLMIFAIFNLCSHLAALDMLSIDENNFFIAALIFVVMLMNVIGGRIAPNFLKNKYRDVKQFSHKALLPASMISIVVVMVAIVFSASDVLIASFSLLAAMAILIRVLGWNGWVAIGDPLMIILHIGVLWISVGFFLMAYAYYLDYTFIALSYHAFSVGAAGSLTLGVMTRAVLGHSGMPMNNEFIITLYFVLINIAALSRIVAPLYFADYYLLMLNLSGVCWVLAYALFLVRVIPVVIRPRADGKPG